MPTALYLYYTTFTYIETYHFVYVCVSVYVSNDLFAHL